MAFDFLKKVGLMKDLPEENTTEKKIVEKNPAKKEVTTSIKTSPIMSSVSSTNTVGGVPRQEIYDYFKKVFVENNIPGPDYQEFKNALEDMKNEPLDEATKVKNLFKAFKSMGLTPQKLISTANEYKKLFAAKLKQFDGELAAEFENEVGAREKQVQSLLDENKKIDDEMRKLNEKKLANEAKSRTLNEEIQKNTAELNSNKNDWHATYDDIIKEIDGHIGLFNTHLVEKTPTV